MDIKWWSEPRKNCLIKRTNSQRQNIKKNKNVWLDLNIGPQIYPSPKTNQQQKTKKKIKQRQKKNVINDYVKIGLQRTTPLHRETL